MTKPNAGNPKPFKLGEYSTDPTEHEAEIAQRQEATVRDVGDYVLQQTPQYRHWRARTKDGTALPRPLEGLWSSVGHFQAAAEKYQSKFGSKAKSRGRNAQ